ncbi:TRAP transporter small permease subunit [Cobetia amphilecti]|jgi:TRAP-type mannitol/chloroaromatic compound transport system permease small subunit|uniref:TRAP transporter small permease protein n=3 Tax=Gammaproteobacteria TaxID=1236 RepID=A0AAP4TXG0_9GAMM|nr:MULTISPECIES: TRAP transporter small permease subunit [Cobetia]MBR9799626.1 TRAP transporter small permease subunit [Gammaproteobacteria bacterium]TCJ25966.1 TRAP transporter small permease subunit [Halomonas sp. GDM18]KPM80644.1 C4-dicarboxylate ABC transporter permease [Cobetia sp. UCD-24C]MBF10396.1 C4-dicarboxylate ABC transporter permease [Cobetia sp.]MDH2420009.1 TRAP transporter small permease subunit [Cobetia litoralis]|tara:strand:- start:63594 stop:64124 length:531 start_codon:yes stop_codon:yes gene_type:complete
MLYVIHFLEGIIERLGVIARYSLLALVLLVASNVLLRYFFSISPVPLQEFEWHLISPIALLGISYALKHRADVRVDVFYDRFSLKGRALVDLIGALMTIAIGAAIAWLGLSYTEQSWQLMEGSPDPGGLPYRYLLKAFIPLGFAALALQGVADCLRALLVLSGKPVDGDLEREVTP